MANKKRNCYNPALLVTKNLVTKKKIDLAAVLRHLNSTCPKCGYTITPAEIVRIDFERQRCPKCGAVFEAFKAPEGRKAHD